MLKRILVLFTILLMIIASIGCGKNNTPTQPSNNTTPTPTVNTLGISPEIFMDRWNRFTGITEESTLSLKEAPGTGGTDKTNYTLSKNISMTVNIAKDQNKVRDLTIKSNIFKMEEAESETMGKIYFLAIQTAEQDMTEEELNSLLDEFGEDIDVGYNKTIIKRNTSFQLKVSAIGTMELIVKNKNA